MGRFNEYGERINETVHNYFAAFGNASAALERAEFAKKRTPRREGVVTAEYAAQAARAEAEYLEAKAQLDELVRCGVEDTRAEIANIRAELNKSVEKVYSVDPAKVDMATLELLKSGIMKPFELMRLAESAKSTENFTMLRVIAKHAETLAEAEKDEAQAKTLRMIAAMGSQATGAEHLQAFELMADLFERCVRTPANYREWDRLTKNAREII